MRGVFFDAWKKFRDQQALSPLEQLIVEVATRHPEYHPILDNADANLDKDVFPQAGDNNPFVHMGLHLALIEQIKMDRPTGITLAHRNLVQHLRDEHKAEHAAIDCLAEWLAEGPPHDESVYLNRLNSLAGDNQTK